MPEEQAVMSQRMLVGSYFSKVWKILHVAEDSDPGSIQVLCEAVSDTGCDHLTLRDEELVKAAAPSHPDVAWLEASLEDLALKLNQSIEDRTGVIAMVCPEDATEAWMESKNIFGKRSHIIIIIVIIGQ